MSSDQVILARVSVSPKAFKTFSDGLKIALGKTENESDVDILTKALKTYNGNLKVDIQNNLLVLEAGDHTGFIEMTADEFVDEHCPKFPDLQWDMGVEVLHTILQKVVQNIGTLTTKDDTPTVNLSIRDKICYFEVARGNHKLLLKTTCDYKDCSFTFNGKYFTHMVRALDGNVMMSIIDNEKPILIKEKIDKLLVQYVIAPIVNEEKEKPEKKKGKKKEEDPTMVSETFEG